MNITEFTEKVVKAAREVLGEEYRVESQEILKNNGTRLHGIIIRSGSVNIAPTLYVDPYLRAYEEGMHFGDIMNELLGSYRRGLPGGDVDMDFFRDYEKVKDRICFKLISAEKNEKLLEDIPYLPFLDLAIVFYYAYVGETIGEGSILIHKNHMELWNVKVSDLMRVATANSPRLFPASCRPIAEILEELMHTGADEDMQQALPMLVASNDHRVQGAGVILYPEMLAHVAEETQQSLYILPSSVHEVILLPDSGDLDPAMLKELIVSINRTQVEEPEVLSDSLYYYDLGQKEIRIAA